MKKYFSIIATVLLTQFFCFGLIQSAYLPSRFITTAEEDYIEIEEYKPVAMVAIADEQEVETKPSRIIDPGKPMIALTFDDGPSDTTSHILELLEQYDARATFFVVGSRARSRADVLLDIIEQGSEIGNHSWSHYQMTFLSTPSINYELQQTNAVIEEITGVKPVVFRAPYGLVNERLIYVAREMNMPIINWSVDPQDWRTRSSDRICYDILNRVYDGSIILCHDLIYQTGTAMEYVIPALIDQGYQLVTISELFTYSGHKPAAGRIYSIRPQPNMIL